MRIRNLTVSNSRLAEGSYHFFHILKSIELGENDSWFVMQDPLGYKVLMPAGFYEKYGFQPGQKVKCRVDRINCSGRMFLEPMHPHYTEGEVYSFQPAGEGKQKSITGDEEFFFRVKDLLGYEWKVRVNSREQIPDMQQQVRCRLNRIKKGKLHLSLENDVSQTGTLETGKSYDFLISDEKINPDDGLKYFILTAPDRSRHVLKKKYYLHYGLKKGQQIRCRVDKFTGEGYYFLEPENPWYKEGKTYAFKPLEIHKLNFSDGTIEDVLVLDDPHGEPIKQFIDSGEVEKLQNRDIVNCRVLRIRKSRIELEVI